MNLAVNARVTIHHQNEGSYLQIPCWQCLTVFKFTEKRIRAKARIGQQRNLNTWVLQELRRLLLYGQNRLIYRNEIYMTIISYLSSINSDNFMYLA